MSIQKVTGFKTTDGKFFIDKEDAELQQASLDFDAWYEVEAHELFAMNSRSVSASEIKNWLNDHREEVLEYLGISKLAVEGAVSGASSNEDYAKLAAKSAPAPIPRNTAMPPAFGTPYGTEKGTN